jgi:hypothetical protein
VNDIDFSRARWRTSRHSGNGGECVEVAAVWRKSSRSNNGGNCVEVAALDGAAWRKSARSNDGGECVEVADAGPAIAVRDSKDPEGPHLDFSASEWRVFVTGLQGRKLDLA